MTGKHQAGFVDEALIADLLLSERVQHQVIGRLMATGVTALVERWATEEVRRGTNFTDIATAVNVLGAGIAATGMPPLVIMDEKAISAFALKLSETVYRIMEETLRERLKVTREQFGEAYARRRNSST